MVISLKFVSSCPALACLPGFCSVLSCSCPGGSCVQPAKVPLQGTKLSGSAGWGREKFSFFLSTFFGCSNMLWSFAQGQASSVNSWLHESRDGWFCPPLYLLPPALFCVSVLTPFPNPHSQLEVASCKLL